MDYHVRKCPACYETEPKDEVLFLRPVEGSMGRTEYCLVLRVTCSLCGIMYMTKQGRVNPDDWEPNPDARGVRRVQRDA